MSGQGLRGSLRVSNIKVMNSLFTKAWDNL